MSPSSSKARARDWAALPSDILLDVFLRLGPREVMLGAEFACKPWRRLALEEPSLWRRVVMYPCNLFDKRWRRVVRCRADRKMTLVAVDRAKGQCEAFKGSCNDDNVHDLVRRAPSLKSFNIEYCGYFNQSNEDWMEALQKLHQSSENLIEALLKLTLLEDLRIHFRRCIYWDENMLESVSQACPRLSKLTLVFPSATDLERNEDEFRKVPVNGPVPVMAKLHTLELFDCDLSVEGLNSILDSCPLLETMRIDGYFDKREMDKELRLKCNRVKNLTLRTRERPDNSFFGEVDNWIEIS